MVPTTFVMLKEFPLTPTGKLDRKALPAPEELGINAGDRFAAPRTPVQEVLAETWAAILGVERVGIHDNFFELGGHSLLAAQVISKARKAFQIELPLGGFFELPTVAGLSERVDAAMRAGEGLLAPPIVPVARNADLPLSFAQHRLWLIDQLESGSAAYNIPAAVRLTGDLDARALEQSFTETVRRHEVLRTSFAA